MEERESSHETIDRGELFFLNHPGMESIISGYGLTIEQGRNDLLAGLLMVDRPRPANPEWLKQVENVFGEFQLVPMTATGEHGIVCQMLIEPDSTQHLRQLSSTRVVEIITALEPLINEPPKPLFVMHWDEEVRAWQSLIAYPNELPREIRDVFEKFGYGCLSLESDIGIIHVCHAPDSDIEGFSNKPVISRWQLIKMPSAPLIRLEINIIDQPENPYRFESFLNVAEQDQEKVLAELAYQDRLYLAFYGDNLNYRFTKVIPHDQ